MVIGEGEWLLILFRLQVLKGERGPSTGFSQILHCNGFTLALINQYCFFSIYKRICTKI